MNANQNVVIGDVVKFNNAKTVEAVPMTPAQTGLFEMGVHLGADDGQAELDWTAALRLARKPEDRKILRAGFIHGRAPDAAKGTKAYVSANSRFDYLAKLYAPSSSSRKAKANAKKAGRKEKAKAIVSKMSEKDLAARNMAAIAYIAKAQTKYESDSDVTDVLGDLLAILAGKRKK